MNTKTKTWIAIGLLSISMAVLAIVVGSQVSMQRNLSGTVFLLRTTDDVQGVADRLLEAIARRLAVSRSLPMGYPIIGHITMSADPQQVGVELLNCTAGQESQDPEGQCIAMEGDRDFIRVRPITWQTEALHLYTIYVLSPSPFLRVDPASTPFVEVAVFSERDVQYWTVANDAILDALEGIGANEYHR